MDWIAALAFCLPAEFAPGEWPTKPVRLIVPSAAGASNDACFHITVLHWFRDEAPPQTQSRKNTDIWQMNC